MMMVVVEKGDDDGYLTTTDYQTTQLGVLVTGPG